MQIETNKVVIIDYTLTDTNGNILDASQGGEFAYLHGASNIIPGLENALSGKAAGDELTVTVAPAEGYGERNDALKHTVGMDMFENTGDVKVGNQFQAQGNDGNMMIITITAVDDDQVTIDGNHPLAGEELNFQVKVIDVRDATEEEVNHGHVHGPGGHDH
jgi:FKBP-type peptidyl-prolyl cis-trans isomerase SlyD